MGATELLQVPKKTRRSEKTADQHASGFMLRLPEKYKDALELVKSKTGIPMTVSVQMALEKHFRALGIEFQWSWPEQS
jgi:hypothetical protein